MAPSIENFHHIEIDNIGKRRRETGSRSFRMANLHPPGGESSDIFNFRKPSVIVLQPRKVKFYNRSNIFPVESAPDISRLRSHPPSPCTNHVDPKYNTKQRLFGPPDEVPRSPVDRMKSSIFATDIQPQCKPRPNSEKHDRRNPITGEKCGLVKHIKRHQIEKMKSNPITGEGYESPDEYGSSRSLSSMSSNCSSIPSQRTMSDVRPSSSEKGSRYGPEPNDALAHCNGLYEENTQ